MVVKIFTVHLRKDGRITIPYEVRKALDLKEGELLDVTISKSKVL